MYFRLHSSEGEGGDVSQTDDPWAHGKTVCSTVYVMEGKFPHYIWFEGSLLISLCQ